MARRFTLQIIMDLATRIGANPAKAVSRSNISFLGKGPTKNPLFQSRLAGLENATEANLGKPETLFAAIDDAVGWAKDGKLNGIQTEILGHNLSGIAKIIDPPPLPTLPMASVTAIRPGIEGLRRFPKDTHKFMGRPLKDKDFSEIDRMVMEGKIPDARGRTWNLKAPGPGNLQGVLDVKTGMSRAIARQLLQQDTRLKLTPEELFMLKEGKGEPLDLMRKYYGRSVMNFDEWLDDVIPRGRYNENPRDLATRVLSEVDLIPQFAEGGLAEILQAPRSGYSKGRLVRGALAILNRNKKNADYMFKASDNVSPGYARGDIKYNAELLADQLAEDAGVIYDDLGALERTKFYGTAYDYLAKEMGQYRQMTKMLKDVEQKMQLSDFSIKGRKPSASGGRIGFFKGAQADTAEGKAMSPGTSADYTPGAGHRDAWKQEAAVDFNQILQKQKRTDKTEVVPVQSFTGNFNQLDKLGLQARNKNLYAAGLLSIEDVMKGDIKPDIYAGISGDNFNIEGQKTKDMTGLYGNTSIGPVNVQGSYQDYDGDVNKTIGASYTFPNNVQVGANYDFQGNPTFGASYNTDNFSGGLTYDGEPKAMFNFSKVLEPRPKYIFGKSKGGLAGILGV
jgi:hypothetical protein